METNGPPSTQPVGNADMEVPQFESPNTADQSSRPSSAEPLSQDELDIFLSPPSAVVLYSSTTEKERGQDTLCDQASSTPPFPVSPAVTSLEDPTLSINHGLSQLTVNELPIIGEHSSPFADPPSLDVCETRGSPETAVQEVQSGDEEEQEYTLKEIYFSGEKRKIVMQGLNGPCPLIAVVNALVLQGRFSFGKNEFKVSLARILSDVADKILNEMEKRRMDSEETREANVEAALQTLQKCYKGLDVNVRFGKVDAFEFTETLALFDILKLTLLHGWIADEGTLSVIGQRSYNEIITAFLITEETNEAKLIKEWLEDNQSQLTFEGIHLLRDKLRNEEVAIMFRNNHFTTITKFNDCLYILLTDMGFLSLDALVFESLVDVNQSSSFFANGQFDVVNAEGDVIEPSGIRITPPIQADTIHDEDHAFAFALQQEEVRIARERETQIRRNEGPGPSRRQQERENATENYEKDKKKTCTIM